MYFYVPTKHDPDIKEKYRAILDEESRIGYFYLVETDENDEVVEETLTMVQPHKPNIDGTKSNWSTEHEMIEWLINFIRKG